MGDKLTFKNLSWPEQLARMKKARSAFTRASIDSCNSADSVDSPSTINLEKKEIKTSNTSLQPKYNKGPTIKSKTIGTQFGLLLVSFRNVARIK